MRISNDGPEVFSSYASCKSRSEITVWMPWPLIRDLGGGAKWSSNHFRLYSARCICTEAQEMRAPCMFDWQGTQTFFSGWNAKSQIRSLVCTLRNSNIAITSLVCTLHNSNCEFQMIIQITHLLSCENSLNECSVNNRTTVTVFTRWSDCGVEPGKRIRSVFWGCTDPRLHSDHVHGADPATGADRKRARCLHYEISRASYSVSNTLCACMCKHLYTVLYFFPEFWIVSHCRECIHNVHWYCFLNFHSQFIIHILISRIYQYFYRAVHKASTL